jgi:hypothetical protein
MLALVTEATGPSSQTTLSAFRPRCAVQKESATTATPFVTSTTSFTPLIRLAAVASKDLTLPPKTGQRSIEAISMPGTTTSMPKTAEPLT